AEGLEKQSSAEVVAALARSVGSDGFWGVRAAAASTLGHIRTTAARDALVAALALDMNPRARRAVVKALGEFRNDETAAAALENIVRAGDPSYFVEADSSLAL